MAALSSIVDNYGIIGLHRDEAVVASAVARMARTIHRGSMWPLLCRNAIVAMLLRQHLQFRVGKREYALEEVQPQFREIVGQYWIPFITDYYDEMMCLGVVIVRFIKAPTGDTVPIVVKSNTLGITHFLTVRFNYKMGCNKYRVFHIKRTDKYVDDLPKEDRKAIVMTRYGYEPEPTGVIRSPIAALISIEHENILRRVNNQQADATLSDPPIILTSTNIPPVGAEDASDIFTSDAERYMRNLQGVRRDDVEHANQVRTHIDTNYANAGKGWRPRWPGDTKKQISHNTFTIPVGFTVANIPRPERNRDAAAFEGQYREAVAAAYGLPISIFTQNESFRAMGSVEQSRVLLALTMGKLSTELSRVLTDVYAHIYASTDLCYMLNVIPKGPKDKPMGIKEMFEKAHDASHVEITIAAAPTADVQMAVFMYIQGVIDWGEYCAHLRSHGNFPPRAPPPEPARKPAVSEPAPPPAKRAKTGDSSDQEATRAPAPASSDPLTMATEFIAKRHVT